MKNKLVLCISLAIVLSVTGCTWFRQPDPGNQPNVPDQRRPTEPQLPQNQQEFRGAERNQVQPLASDIIETAKDVSGVNNAAAIVMGNMAIVGIEIQDGVNASQTEEQVSNEIEDKFAEIKTVHITSEAGLMDQISAVSERIRRAQPTSELMDDINDIWQRIQR